VAAENDWHTLQKYRLKILFFVVKIVSIWGLKFLVCGKLGAKLLFSTRKILSVENLPLHFVRQAATFSTILQLLQPVTRLAAYLQNDFFYLGEVDVDGQLLLLNADEFDAVVVDGEQCLDAVRPDAAVVRENLSATVQREL